MGIGYWLLSQETITQQFSVQRESFSANHHEVFMHSVTTAELREEMVIP